MHISFQAGVLYQVTPFLVGHPIINRVERCRFFPTKMHEFCQRGCMIEINPHCSLTIISEGADKSH